MALGNFLKGRKKEIDCQYPRCRKKAFLESVNALGRGGYYVCPSGHKVSVNGEIISPPYAPAYVGAPPSSIDSKIRMQVPKSRLDDPEFIAALKTEDATKDAFDQWKRMESALKTEEAFDQWKRIESRFTPGTTYVSAPKPFLNYQQPTPISYSTKYRFCPKSNRFPHKSHGLRFWRKDRSMVPIGIDADAKTGEKIIYRCTICGYEELYDEKGEREKEIEKGQFLHKTFAADILSIIPRLLMAVLGLIIFSIEIRSFGDGQFQGSYILFIIISIVLIIAAFVADIIEKRKATNLKGKLVEIKDAVKGRYWNEGKKEPSNKETQEEKSSDNSEYDEAEQRRRDMEGLQESE